MNQRSHVRSTKARRPKEQVGDIKVAGWRRLWELALDAPDEADPTVTHLSGGGHNCHRHVIASPRSRVLGKCSKSARLLHSRFKPDAKKVILVPEGPRGDLVDLAASLDVMVMWPATGGYAGSPELPW
jgi:hypothetical protein